MFSKEMRIEGYDDELFAAIRAEERRQEEHIELIASENYTSPRVMEAQGSVLTNKYAEGYPGKRYYGGCEHVDVNLSTRPNNWRSIGRNSCSAPTTRMSSLIPVPPQTWPCTWRCVSRATPCSACRWPTAVT